MTKRRERPTMIDNTLHIKLNIQKHKPRVDSVLHFPLNGILIATSLLIVEVNIEVPTN
jgi:hypothetical protein